MVETQAETPKMTTAASRVRRVAVVTALVLPFAAILLVHARHYLPFISDDALISLRYAKRLLEGQGLTWTAGRPVEGYSNLLWILLVASLGVLRVDLILAARLLGVVSMLVAMASLAWSYARGERLATTWPAIVLPLLFLALAAPVAVWAIGGLEQPLYAALIALSIALFYRVVDSPVARQAHLAWLSFVLGLLCLTRPDGAIFPAAAAISLFLAGWRSGLAAALRRAAAVLGLPVAFFLGQLAFRLIYYGEVVPNTALVKLAFSATRLRGGFNYLRAGLTSLSPLSLVALASLVVALAFGDSRRRATYLVATAVFWSAYVAAIGGDIFPAYRHLVPLLVVFAFAMAEAARAVLVRCARPTFVFAFATLGLILVVPFASAQFRDPQSQRAIRERWEWQGKDLALLLKGAFSDRQPVLAVTAAGCLPYWSELPSLDMMGLNDYYLPRHPPADIGSGWVGHELGDGAYVLRSNPDVIDYTVGSEPWFRVGDQLRGMAAFHDRYVPVTVVTAPRGDRALVYFNKYSSKIGVVQAAGQTTIPGFLFTGDGAIARLDGGNRLVVQVTRDRPVHLRFEVHDAPGAWQVDVNTSQPGSVVSDVQQDGRALSITLKSSAEIPITVQEIVLRPAR